MKEIKVYTTKGRYLQYNDYMDSFLYNIPHKLILLDDIESLKSLDENYIYIFINSMPHYVKYNDDISNVIFFNLEQTTCEDWLKRINDINLFSVSICDYRKDDVNRLSFMNENTDKVYDVVFIGDTTQYRLMKLDELYDKGINIKAFKGVYEDERDIEFCRAKIVINLHLHNNFNVYENLRCDRLLFSKMLIISETSVNNSSLDIADLVIFESYDKIVDKIEDVLTNYDVYYSKFIENYNIQMPGIIDARKNALKKFEDRLKSFE
jgi:hypothetical protein